MFDLIRLGIELVSTVSIADALFMQTLLNGKILLENKLHKCRFSRWYNQTLIFFFRVYCFKAINFWRTHTPNCMLQKLSFEFHQKLKTAFLMPVAGSLEEDIQNSFPEPVK